MSQCEGNQIQLFELFLPAEFLHLWLVIISVCTFISITSKEGTPRITTFRYNLCIFKVRWQGIEAPLIPIFNDIVQRLLNQESF